VANCRQGVGLSVPSIPLVPFNMQIGLYVYIYRHANVVRRTVADIVNSITAIAIIDRSNLCSNNIYVYTLCIYNYIYI
jgi:hypothetical protein